LFYSIVLFFLREALKKRRKRAERALKEGRSPGLPGRPGLTDCEVEDDIVKRITSDANDGIFHDVKSLWGMV
jgi:hypothetical protein